MSTLIDRVRERAGQSGSAVACAHGRARPEGCESGPGALRYYPAVLVGAFTAPSAAGDWLCESIEHALWVAAELSADPACLVIPYRGGVWIMQCADEGRVELHFGMLGLTTGDYLEACDVVHDLAELPNFGPHVTLWACELASLH